MVSQPSNLHVFNETATPSSEGTERPHCHRNHLPVRKHHWMSHMHAPCNAASPATIKAT